MAVTGANSLTIVSKDSVTNTAVVRYIVDLTTTGQSWWNYDVKCQYTIDGVSGENESYTRLPLNSKTRVLDVQKTIYNASGKTVNASFSYYTGTSSGTITGNASVYIDLPRYANFTEHYIQSTTINAIFVRWNADASCDAVQYSLNGGNWTDASGTTYAISGLQPNTNYNIKTRIRRADSGLWTESGTLSTTTKDIGRIAKLQNFEHGNNVNIEITNPSRISFKFSNENWRGANTNKKCISRNENNKF